MQQGTYKRPCMAAAAALTNSLKGFNTNEAALPQHCFEYASCTLMMHAPAGPKATVLLPHGGPHNAHIASNQSYNHAAIRITACMHCSTLNKYKQCDHTITHAWSCVRTGRHTHPATHAICHTNSSLMLRNEEAVFTAPVSLVRVRQHRRTTLQRQPNSGASSIAAAALHLTAAAAAFAGGRSCFAAAVRSAAFTAGCLCWSCCFCSRCGCSCCCRRCCSSNSSGSC
jgi:hypothetical protein